MILLLTTNIAAAVTLRANQQKGLNYPNAFSSAALDFRMEKRYKRIA